MIFGLHVIASAAQEPERIHVIPFFPSASDAYRDGLARVINHSGEAGEVRIEGFDEEGEFYGAVMLSVDAGEAVHFNSEDLESGAAEKGLSGAIGPGEGAWRLQLSSERDIEVLSYFRTADGFLTAMHDTVAHEGGVHRVAFFNPGSNYARRSVLRLVNPGEEAAAVSIVGVDGRGESPGSEVTTTIPARASRTFTAAALESGGEGFEGALGDGEGKWRLRVESAQPLVVMSLLSDPTGRLSNLSTAPGSAQGSVHAVHFLPSASGALRGRSGFARVVNHSGEAGEVRIDAVDDEGETYGPVVLSVDAGEAVQFSSEDLESGNAEQGLSGATGPGEGDWRLELTSERDIEVLSYVRTADGLLTAMHDVAPSEGGRHRVAFFNPASNNRRASVLRLVNPGEEAAAVSIAGVDDRGESPGSEVTTTIPAGASRTFTAAALESGDEGLEGALDDGEGKWRLLVQSAQPLVVMSLLSDLTGHLSNLSTAPGRESQARPDLVVEPPSVSNRSPVAGQAFSLSATVRNDGGADSPVTALRYYRSSDATITATDRALGTDAVAGLAASGSASESVTVSAPSTPGRYYYGACVDAVAEEFNTANNCSAAVEVNVRESESESEGQPDLMVASPRVSDDHPAAETTFILSIKVSNAGDGASPSAMMRYHRSSDSTITPSDTPAGTDEVARLGASGSDSKSVEQTAPSTPGTYYFGACVDAVAGESDTANNCSASVEVRVPEPETESQGQPELSIPAVSVAASPGGTYTHDAFTLSATVRNRGDGDSAATTLRYYRSLDATITTLDSQVGTDPMAGLAASANGSASVELSAPSTPGTYYYGACVDTVAEESDTTNNCSASRQVEVLDPHRPPNLVVASPSVYDNSPVAGGTFTLSATVRNDGVGDSAATTLRYYQSTDATLTTSDAEVGTDAVAGLAASASRDESVELNAPSEARTYYYGACVDAVAEESDTTDNCSTSVKVDVREPPDPVVQSVEVTPGEVTFASLGDTATLTARVLDTQGNEMSGEAVSWSSNFPNVATVNAAGVMTAVANGIATMTASASGVSDTATVIVYQRADSVDIDPGEVELTSVGETVLLTLRAIDANGHEAPYGGDLTSWRWRSADPDVATVSPVPVITLEAEVQAVASGTTTVTVTAVTEDGGTLIGTATVKVTVTQTSPDLSVGLPTVDDTSPETGATFTLSARVSNAGDAAAAATTLRYYRSSDATITSSDTAVGTDDVGALPASGTSAESIELTAPSDEGTYYYGACVDAVTGESDTINNCSSSVQVDVEEPPQTAPDLDITAIVVSSSPWGTPPGANLGMSVGIRNKGSAVSAATTLRYYRSTDATITTSDTEEATDTVEGLAASGTVTLQEDLTAPSTAGAYYYGACVDAVSGESDTTNNCSGSVKVDVEAPQPSASSVEVSAPQEWAPVGGTVTYSARVLDSEGEEMSGYTISWSSSDTLKATVDSSGVVTAVAVGETTISASASATAAATVKASSSARNFDTAASGSRSTLSGSLKMHVVKPVARIELSPSSLSFDEVGGWEFVTATLYDADGNEMRPTYWGWRSADEEVVDVSTNLIGSGVSAHVQSIGEGTTTVSLNANGTRKSMSVTVTLPVARVDISPRSLTFESLGDTRSVTVRVLDADGDEVENATFAYTAVSSACCRPDVDLTDPSVFGTKRTDDGLEITSRGPGSGRVTISSTDVEPAILPVTVYKKPATLEVSPSSASLEVDGTATLRAALKDANGHSIHVAQGDGQGGHVVYWETSDSAVATVEGSTASGGHNTGASATVTALAAGTATITGSWGNRVTDTATVTVTESN